jgi:dienelactone hydrolase
MKSAGASAASRMMAPMASRSVRVAAAALCIVAGGAWRARSQELPRGVVIDDVKCADDAGQSYSLYLPSTYRPDRVWNLLIGFHPGARGRAIVETYQAAAEQYGYIVAGSNTARNGPWAISMASVRAMSADLGLRFSVDVNRLYLTGLSGGARVALQVALTNNNIAGVIASSAGYPDNKPRGSVPFALFGTAGTDDFNYIEMRQLDRKLTSPHRLAVFNGGHTLPPPPVALEAIEWMEVQAMKSGRRPKDAALVERLFAKRQQLVESSASETAAVHLLEAAAEDFGWLRDVSAETARAAELSRQPEVRKALARERADDEAEVRLVNELYQLEAGLRDEERHGASLARLRDQLLRYARAADSVTESNERSRARRVLRLVTMGADERVDDPQYLRLLQEIRSRGRQ